MKVHYINILFFAFPLNILEHSKNKPSITPQHTTRYTSRVLSEKDIRSTNSDNDPQMKRVKQQYDNRTSQRLLEYHERMKDKRQKRKEERDKNIQKIIEKDKREKSLAEKVEKGCLRCGCALGGGVLPVWGLVSGLWFATLSQYATKTAIEAGIKAGLKEGLENVMKIAKLSLADHTGAPIPTVEMLQPLAASISGDNITLHGIFECINSNIEGLGKAGNYELFSTTVKRMVEKTFPVFNSEYKQQATAVASAVEETKAAEFAAKTGLLSNTIIASVVTIIIIVLIMVIIYLVLRYRRKKKMNKKAQYTKLLNQ
ncbi:rifin PIR protein, putative [Plasmodium reichenowi]|uniref:Rifin PIR protein, putative n=1 Tax=Plasmodium reichenowi TaxID=5854 RepID=A0A2P9D1Q4_PLARE|nr:rifin PIR protein, putative [Plasmodium reichenowi]